MSTISSAMASGKRNLRLLSIAILVMATSFAPNSVVSGLSIPLNSLESSQLSSPLYSKVSLERAAVTEFLYDSMDRLNGGQFLELVDPLMEGQLSRIIEQIKHKYSEQTLNRLAFAPELPARQFLSILDYLSSGQVSASLHASFPTLLSSNILADRPRRASLDTMSGLSLGYAKKRSLDPMSGLSFGAPAKRAPGGNFDEMDRTGFSGFAKRRSDFDEIDRAGFSGFAKRNSDFDEIDRSGFSGFAKRRSDFDEIDRAGFSGFAKRRSDFDEIDRAGFSGFAKRFNFDELDRNGFTGFLHKRAMNPLVSMMQSQELSRKQKAAEAQKQSQPEQAVPVKQQSKA